MVGVGENGEWGREKEWRAVRYLYPLGSQAEGEVRVM